MGISTKYGFAFYREIKDIRQKIDGGLTKYGFDFNKEKRILSRKNMAFEQSMDLDSMTHCKIRVNLGFTRCEKSSIMYVSHITITYSISFFITIAGKMNAKSHKTKIFLYLLIIIL